MNTKGGWSSPPTPKMVQAGDPHTCLTSENSHLSLSIHQPVSPEVLGYLAAAHADNTRRAYAQDLEEFAAWGGRVPCSPLTVAEFVCSLAGSCALATLRRRVAGIGWAHRQAGKPDPTRAPIVRQVLRGIHRMHGCPQRRALPITINALEAVFEKSSGLRDARDMGLLAIGFAGALRRSELVSLQVDDIGWEERGVVLMLRHGKTDPARRGRTVAIHRRQGRLCPVSALADWMDLSAVATGPVFRSIDRWGHVHASGLSAQSVGLILKRRAGPLFSAHSLRAGFATSAARAGVPWHEIRQQTGHRTFGSLSNYIRAAETFSASQRLWFANDA